MLIDGQFPVAAPPGMLLAHLFDARTMASCLPGCETLEPLTDDRYRAVVVVAMAGIKARFDLQVEITRRDESNIWAVTRGEEGGRASTLQADSQVSLEAVPEGTLVRYSSEVAVTGRLGRFALGMMKKKAQSLGDEFAANLQRKLEAIGATGNADATRTSSPTTSEAARAAFGAGAVLPSESAAITESAPIPEGSAAAESPAPGAVVSPPEAAPTASARRGWWRALVDWFRGTPSQSVGAKE